MMTTSPSSIAKQLILLITCSSIFLISLLSILEQVPLASAAISSAPQEHALLQSEPTPTATPEIGVPCGRGEHVSPSIVCLHGVVKDSSGKALNGVTVTVSSEEGTVSGITSVHPGQPQVEPSYGIDIQVITPTYLAPITVTATNGNVTVTRQAPVFPDYATHDQEFNLWLPGEIPPNVRIYGYVYDYTTGKPVAGVTVTAELDGHQVSSAPTGNVAFDPYPLFVFDASQLATISATDGTLVNLKIQYNGTDTYGVAQISDTPIQVNAVSGWPCDTSGVLPRGGARFGLPRGGPGRVGLPDEICVWGTGLVDGKPQAGMDVYMTTSDGTTNRGKTISSSVGEAPIYAIRIANASTLHSKLFTVTCVYQGFSTILTTTLSGDAAQQLKELSIRTAQPLSNINKGDSFNTTTWLDPYLWLGMFDKAIRFDPVAQESVVFSSSLGLIYGNINSVQRDTLDRYWFGGQGVSIYDPHSDLYFKDATEEPNLRAWLTITNANGGLFGVIDQIEFDHQENAWVTTSDSVNRIRIFTDTQGLISATIGIVPPQFGTLGFFHPIYADNRDGMWLVSNDQISRIDVATLNVTPFPSVTLGVGSGLGLSGLQFDKYDNVWVSGKNGINRINVVSYSHELSTTQDLGLQGEIQKINLDSKGNVWIITPQDVARIAAHTLTVTTFTSVTLGLDNGIGDLFFDSNDNVWLRPSIYSQNRTGVSRIDGATLKVKTRTQLGLAADLSTVTLDKKDNLWLVSNTGAVRVDGKSLVTKTFANADLGLLNTLPRVAVDDNGNTYLITPEKSTIDSCGDGLVSRISPDGTSWKTFSLPQWGSPYCAFDVSSYGSKFLWITSDNPFPSSFSQIVEQPSDLAVKIDGPDFLISDKTVTYSVSITNTGAGAASLTLVVTLPPGSTLVSSSLPVSSTLPLAWNLDWLPPNGGFVTLTVQAILTGTVGADMIATAALSTTTDENVIINNRSRWKTKLIDPRPDLRVSIVGPPILVTGTVTSYTVWIDNVGGSAVNAANLAVELPPSLSPNVPLQYALSSLEPFTRTSFVIPVTVGEVGASSRLTVKASVTKLLDESNLNNNDAFASTPTAPNAIDTLFVVAGEQLVVQKEQGSSQLFSKLYQLAENAKVKGAVFDVMQFPVVQAAYKTWNQDLSNQQSAIAVATAIRNAIDGFVDQHRQVRYIVLVGGDNIIPYYRIKDASDTFWQESKYAGEVPIGTVQSALKENYLLSDDYYVDGRATNNQLAPFTSDRWPKGRLLYKPDRAVSRLVESADEIIATIDAYLNSDGVINLSKLAVLGGDEELTFDAVKRQCTDLGQSIDGPFCQSKPSDFATIFTSSTWSTAWSAFHSNLMESGELKAVDIEKQSKGYSDTLWINIGCHSGLNVQSVPGDPVNQHDLAQSILGKGGNLIAPTAYGYASKLPNPSYSEEFMLALSHQMLSCSGQTIGAALLQAKHKYLVAQGKWFDPLNEKALLPITLYGLPFWQISVDNTSVCTVATSQTDTTEVQVSAIQTTTAITLPIAIDSTQYMTHNLAGIGTYFEYNGDTLAQDKWQIQPASSIPLSATLADGSWLRSAVLLSANYEKLANFDPVIEQSWIIGTDDYLPPVEPPVIRNGLDHAFPYGVSIYRQLPGARDSQTVANLDLVLGACDAVTNTNADATSQVLCKEERIYKGMLLQLFYSNSSDESAPTAKEGDIQAFVAPNVTFVRVKASDNVAVSAVYGICDNGDGRIEGVALKNESGVWSGICSFAARVVSAQVVDSSGNDARSGWLTPKPAFSAYLPVVMNKYRAPLPDLVAIRAFAEDGKLKLEIQNVGEGTVYDDFWVDLCIAPLNPPSPSAPITELSNQICKGRSYEYLVWLYPGATTPLLTGQRVVLTWLDSNAVLEESIFSHTIPANTPLYIHVDSTNANTTWGGVLEEHEYTGTAYNNILGPVLLPVAVEPPTTTNRLDVSSAGQGSNPPMRISAGATSVGTESELNQSQVWLPLVTR